MNANNFPKVERDGKVAVLYSPGLGVGWSTCAADDLKAVLTMHKTLVEMVEGKQKITSDIVNNLLLNMGFDDPDIYYGGSDDLEIEWVEKGSQFEINEYDGSESVHVIGKGEYLTA